MNLLVRLSIIVLLSISVTNMGYAACRWNDMNCLKKRIKKDPVGRSSKKQIKICNYVNFNIIYYLGNDAYTAYQQRCNLHDVTQNQYELKFTVAAPKQFTSLPPTTLHNTVHAFRTYEFKRDSQQFVYLHYNNSPLYNYQ